MASFQSPIVMMLISRINNPQISSICYEQVILMAYENKLIKFWITIYKNCSLQIQLFCDLLPFDFKNLILLSFVVNFFHNLLQILIKLCFDFLFGLQNELINWFVSPSFHCLNFLSFWLFGRLLNNRLLRIFLWNFLVLGLDRLLYFLVDKLPVFNVEDRIIKSLPFPPEIPLRVRIDFDSLLFHDHKFFNTEMNFLLDLI